MRIPSPKEFRAQRETVSGMDEESPIYISTIDKLFYDYFVLISHVRNEKIEVVKPARRLRVKGRHKSGPP